MIALLIGHIFHATLNRIAKVEDDYHGMMELKKRAEAADIAKSQARNSSVSIYISQTSFFVQCVYFYNVT